MFGLKAPNCCPVERPPNYRSSVEGAGMVDDGVPVVSLDHPEALVRALATVGFAAVRDHGVPETDLAAMRRLLVDLFAVDEEAKRRQAITRRDYRGLSRCGSSLRTEIPRLLQTPSRVTSSTGSVRPNIRHATSATCTGRTGGPNTYRICQPWCLLGGRRWTSLPPV